MSSDQSGNPSGAVEQRTEGSRFGYVALIGRPNVGKSTLLNHLVGAKLSIVTHKIQTTRQRIAGIVSTDRGQIVYLDTPGIHRAAQRALNRYMNRVAEGSLLEADAAIFMIEALRWTEEDDLAAAALANHGLPRVLAVNKVDRLTDKAQLLPFVEQCRQRLGVEDIFLISALTGEGVAELQQRVAEMLPFSQPLYDEDQLTDRSERFLAAEFVREALTLRLHDELPYQLAVAVEQFSRRGDILHINAVIWVERNTQKAIVIGKGGANLKQVGQAARQELEAFFDQKVMLRLWVKVRDGWSSDEGQLRRLGMD